jgi:DNA-binding NarL/FixJ family response regulator
VISTASPQPNLVLVVEDEEVLQRTLLRIVRRRFAAEAASSATEARDVVLRWEILAVLLDVGLPEGAGAGLALLRWIREERPQIATAVVTAHTEHDTISEVRRLGGLFVPKPFDIGTVETTLDELEVRCRIATRTAALERIRTEASLTPREFEILCWSAEGRSLKSYAVHAGRSINSARTHVRRILGKTGCERLAHLLDRLPPGATKL